ncbi:MAG: tetratricopeptide repeat protein [Candidatus Obscuribacterales bacterium]|nr:tetratricopeptide repeat protein [Candidatus Obscuribacterales bacterium]
MNLSGEIKQVLDWQEQRWGQDHPRHIACMETMADLLQMQGKFLEAEPLYWQVLEKKHKLYGESDLQVADTIFDLACLHEKQENWAEAERLFRWVMDLRCRLLTKGDPSLDLALEKLKNAAEHMGHLAPEFQFLSSSKESTAASTKFDFTAQTERARKLMLSRNYEFAEVFINSILDVADAYASGSKYQAELFQVLGRVQFHRKNLKAALQSYETALALFEAVSGKSSRETGAVLEDIGDLRCKLGEAQEAELVYRMAQDIMREYLDCKSICKRLQEKLSSLDELCQLIETEEGADSTMNLLFEENELVRESQRPAPTALNRAASEDDVSSFLWTQYLNTGKRALERNELASAEMMISRALEKANEFGVQDRRLWQTKCTLGSVYLAQGKYVRAEAMYQSAQQLCEKTLGAQHVDNAAFWELLGQMYEVQKDKAQAAACYDRLVTILAKAQKPLVEYANFLKKLERLREKVPNAAEHS